LIKGKALVWDHIIPLARKGTHSIGNLVPACHACNASKGKKLISEWKGRLIRA
jgi:5-methylcytosine-specific restriction endonuclease McrA